MGDITTTDNSQVGYRQHAQRILQETPLIGEIKTQSGIPALTLV